MKLVKEYLGKVSITVEKDYWTSNKSYDRLVIVEVLNVGCYISRKAVPRGVQYSNREYWIRLSKNVALPPSPEPSPEPIEFPIVTEFGDNVDVTIAQKTITDKFTEVDTNIGNVQTSLELGFENVNNTLDRITDEYIAGLNTRLDALDEQLTLTNETVATIEEDLLDHLSKIRTIRESLNDNVEVVNLLKGRVDEIDESLSILTENQRDLRFNTWVSKIRTKSVVYLGDRITEQANDSLMMSKLEDELGIVTNGIVIQESFMSTDRLRYIIDNPEEFGDGTNLWLNEIIIVQLGVTTESIGTFDPTFPLDIENPIDPEDYPETFCGNLSYFLDKLNKSAREDNHIRPIVFIIAPPRPAIHESKKDILVEMSKTMGFVLIDPFNSRYDYKILKNITIEGNSKVVIHYEQIESWSEYVIRNIKENC